MSGEPHNLINLQDWHIRVGAARNGGYVAWAAKTPKLGEGPTDVPPGEVVLFLFDDSEDEALARLKQQVIMEVDQAQFEPGRTVPGSIRRRRATS